MVGEVLPLKIVHGCKQVARRGQRSNAQRTISPDTRRRTKLMSIIGQEFIADIAFAGVQNARMGTENDRFLTEIRPGRQQEIPREKSLRAPS